MYTSANHLHYPNIEIFGSLWQSLSAVLALFGKEDAFHARWVSGCTPSISLDSKLGFLLFQPQYFFCSNSIFVPVPFLDFLWFQPQDLFSFNPRICLIVFPWLLLGFLYVKQPISSSFVCDAFHTTWVLVWIYFQFPSCKSRCSFQGIVFSQNLFCFGWKVIRLLFNINVFIAYQAILHTGEPTIYWEPGVKDILKVM